MSKCNICHSRLWWYNEQNSKVFFLNFVYPIFCSIVTTTLDQTRAGRQSQFNFSKIIFKNPIKKSSGTTVKRNTRGKTCACCCLDLWEERSSLVIYPIISSVISEFYVTTLRFVNVGSDNNYCYNNTSRTSQASHNVTKVLIFETTTFRQISYRWLQQPRNIIQSAQQYTFIFYLL